MATKRARLPREYPVAEIIDVHDGDTVRIRADVGFDFVARKWIRLRDVKAPELHEEYGPIARDVLIALLNEHAHDGFVTLTTFWTPGHYKEIKEEMTFIRYVGLVKTLNEINVNEYMLAAGYDNQGI